MRALIKLIDVKTLVAGALPVLLGSVYSFYRFDEISLSHTGILLLGIILMQSSANMINDVFDHERGADGEAKSDEKMLVSGEATKEQVLKLVGCFLLIDAFIVAYYSMTLHPMILVIAIFGAAVMYMYSAGKNPISYTPFGEATAGLTMGMLVMATVIYIQSGELDMEVLLITIPTSVYIGTILLTNNISDHLEDKRAGRHTLPLRIGIRNAEQLWTISCCSLTVFTAVFAWLGFWPLECMVLVMLLFPYTAISQFAKTEKKRTNKGVLMGLIGKVGVRYHVALFLGVLMWSF